MSSSPASATESTISGTRLVLAMFGMAIVATGLLWFYWDLHLMPYMPLQEALAEEFEDSSPRVEGGQRKMHKGTPLILRVVMRVPFDPTISDVKTQERIEHRLLRTRELATKYADVENFETLEVHLYFQPREKTLKQKTFSKSLREETSAQPDDPDQTDAAASTAASTDAETADSPASSAAGENETLSQ